MFEAGNSQEYAAICFNIKNFKVVNSQYGRDIATQLLLRYTAKMAEEACNHGIIGRLGGDNYMALIHKSHLESFIEKLRSIKFDITDSKGKTLEVELKARAGVYLITGEEVAPGQAVGKMTTTLSICRNSNKEDIL